MKQLIFILFFCAFVFIVNAQTPQLCWDLNGNFDISSSNFIGTTDCNYLIFKTASNLFLQ